MAGKKVMSLPVNERRKWIDKRDRLSVRRQCRLAHVSRTQVYHEPATESPQNLKLMAEIDRIYLRHPEYGYPRMTDELVLGGYEVNHKRVARLMRKMGLQAITPGPHTSRPAAGHEVYPYLLRDVKIDRVNQVWSTDITYIPMSSGYLYLSAVIDWYSRYVLSWELSNTMESSFCVNALRRALKQGTPEIFNTDQGSQFTSKEFTDVLHKKHIEISMDGKGRAIDNVFIERLWWTLKYEEIYPKDYRDGHTLHKGLERYFGYYNQRRRHSSLDKRTPAQIYYGGLAA